MPSSSCCPCCLLLLFLLVGWFLPGVSFSLDRYRVPVVLVLLAISFLSNQIFDTDHFYRVRREVAPPAPLPSQAFRASQEVVPENRPIVVVAASGGGITASLWTAQVLTSLQREVGEDFARSIRLISSVSGGSVGTMDYLDRFGQEGFPPPGSLPGIREAVGASSLDATAWGIAYPGLLARFSRFLRDRPHPAARLSATFPWVSPISQALGEDGRAPGDFQLHLADGGYYDNHGVVTAVYWLRSLTATPQLEELRRRGVLLALIRAFPERERTGGNVDEDRGWLYFKGGPILTMYNVRTSSQSFHNSVELEMLRDAWEKAYQVRLTPVIFELREKAPLSWKLTGPERKAILDGWREKRNQDSLRRVRELFPAAVSPGGSPPPAPGSDSSDPPGSTRGASRR